jgi:hypothetical protein
MEGILLAVVCLAVAILTAIWLIARAISAREAIGALSRRLERLERETAWLKANLPPPASQPASAKTPEAAPPPIFIAPPHRQPAPGPFRAPRLLPPRRACSA